MEKYARGKFWEFEPGPFHQPGPFFPFFSPFWKCSLMTSITASAEWLDAKVRSIFGDWEGKGFVTRSASVKNTRAIGDYVEVLVENRPAGRRLLFMYAPASDEGPESGSVFLENERGDTFSVGEYLSYKKVGKDVEKVVSLSSYSGPLEERIVNWLTASKGILVRYLEGSLFRNEWEHVPVDWGGLR